jgi:hypothetical protein
MLQSPEGNAKLLRLDPNPDDRADEDGLSILNGISI